MESDGKYSDLAALEDFANDTQQYASDDDDDDRCSYDEDLDPGHIDSEMNQTKSLDPDAIMLVGKNRENGDGQEHLEISEDKSPPSLLKKKILPSMALALFDEDEDDTGLPSPSSSPPHNIPAYPRPLSLHEELESFDAKLGQQVGSVSAEGSFSSSEDDEPELLACLQRGGSMSSPEQTPDPFHDSAMDDDEWEWESSQATTTPPMLVEPIPEYTAAEELEEERSWRVVQTADGQFRIDMKVIEPYKKVLSHGGYYGDGFNAIVVFNACFLPDRSRHDYHYVMDNLFLYVVSTLELLVVEDYMLLFFHGGTPKSKMPGFRWLRRCYQMIDRRLRKNLKKLVIVHPTLWLRTIMVMTRPLISAKFSAKIQYMKSLQQLHDLIPTEFVFIPDEIKAYDATMTGSIASYSRPPAL